VLQMRVRKKSEFSQTRAVTRTNLSSGKVTRFVDQVRDERFEQWSGKRVLTRALLLYLSLAGVVGISQFVLMESVKNPSFSLGTCQTLLKSVDNGTERDTVVSVCREAFSRQIAQAQFASDVNGLVGWVNPLTAPIYQSFFVANMQNLGFEQVLFESAVKSVKPYQATVKNQTAPWAYQYITVAFAESDVKGLNAMLQHEAALGFHIKDVYHTKIFGNWMVVVVFERVCQSGVCPVDTQ